MGGFAYACITIENHGMPYIISLNKGDTVMSVFETIRQRRSVRTFEKKKIDNSVLEELKEYAKQIENPWNIEVRYVFMDAEECGLSSPVLSGEPMYIAALVDKTDHAEEAAGYAFEKLMLKAVSMGLGTVWIGGTMKRELFETACGKTDHERMPCITPLGIPAKMSFKEKMMRKGVGADTRMKSEKLFFAEDMDHPLKADSMDIHDALEAVRLAPSAVNKQPWRIILKDGLYHFYEKHAKGYISDAVGDMQRIDMGIAVAHFDLVLNERGLQTELVISDPGIPVDEDMEYIASVKVSR